MSNKMPTLITAERLTQIIIDHVKGGRIHAVYSLIATRDHIWADAINALQERPAPTKPIRRPGDAGYRSGGDESSKERDAHIAGHQEGQT